MSANRPDIAVPASSSAAPARVAQLDVVLPLRRSDFDRFLRLLHPSLIKYGAEVIHRCWIVTPEADVSHIERDCPAGPYWVISEQRVISSRYWQKVDSWFRQQILKLCIADRIATPIYLTMDADVIFTRNLEFNELVLDGRPWMCRRASGPHVAWHRWSERALQRPWDHRHYAVTPALLVKEAVLRLLAYMARGSRLANWTDDKRLRIAATDKLIEQLPWTEYTLYGIFLASEGLLDGYHWVKPESLYGNCVWKNSSFDAWDPALSFNEDRHIFTVIQSTCNIPVSRILGQIGPSIGYTAVEPVGQSRKG